jgi:hypothetical protein
MKNQHERIEHILKFMEWDNITDSQHDYVVSFEKQYKHKGYLTDRQMQVLESIFKQGNEY